MKVNAHFARALWLLPLVLCGLGLAGPLLFLEHPGFRVAARSLDSVITPPSDTPAPPIPPPAATETPIPPPEAPTTTRTATPSATSPPAMPTHTPLPQTRTATPASTPTPAPATTPTPTSAPAVTATPATPAGASTVTAAPGATDTPSPATPLPPGVKYVVRAETVAHSAGSTWLIHVCVFDTVRDLRAPAANTGAHPTPTASPTPAHPRVVATDIEVIARVGATARILSGWSDSGRAELTARALRFHTPALREFDVLRYTIEIEAADAEQAWQARVRDARGPGLDLSDDPALQCGPDGLFLITPPDTGARALTATSFDDEPTGQDIVAPPISRPAATDAGASPRGPGASAGPAQALLSAGIGAAGLACLIAALLLRRRQRQPG